MARLKHLHSPLQRTDSAAQRAHTIAAALSFGAHTIGWTEVETQQQVNLIEGARGYGTYWPRLVDGSPTAVARNAVPISWRLDTWRFIKGGSVQASEGKAGVSPSRYVTWILLEEKTTGFRCHFVQSHFVSGVDGLGKPPRQWRRTAHAANVTTFWSVVDRLAETHPVIASLDANTTRLPKLMPSLSFERTDPTHGTRRIDYVAVVGVELTPRGAGTRPLGTSDHKAILAHYDTPAEEPIMRLPDNLARRLRAAGLDVVEIPGWQTRGRPASTGSFDPVGVLWHHTGGAADGVEYARWMAIEGRSDLPAPLAQLSIGRDGTVYVLAAGRANHAGRAKASGSVAAGDGNSLYVGVECHNTGSEGWSPPQYAAMVTTGVVVGDVLGCTTRAQRAHKETSLTGKWDPGGLDMDRFRADIGAHTTLNPREDWSDMATADEVRAIVREEINEALRREQSNGRTLAGNIRAGGGARDFARANSKALEALAAGIGPEVREAVRVALAEGVDIDITVTDNTGE